MNRDAHMLQGLLSSFGGVLPDWLAKELAAPAAAAPSPAYLAACKSAVFGDAVLAAFAEKITANLQPKVCAGRLRAQEVLIACANPNAGTVPNDCALKPLGLFGPCSFRCQPEADKNTLALWRDAIRYLRANYRFSPGQEAPAGAGEKVERTLLSRLPLERA